MVEGKGTGVGPDVERIGGPVGEHPSLRPGDQTIAAAVARVKAAEDLTARAKEAATLGRLDPHHPLVASTREELLIEINRTWAAAQKGAHVPLRSRELNELLGQLPEAP